MVMVETKSYSCICDHCGHRWHTKVNKVPFVCPKCKRTTWNYKADEFTSALDNDRERARKSGKRKF